jgi:hypothetical protein
MKAANLLLQAADVLEKTAAILESTESTRIGQIRQERTKTAQELAEKIANVTGELVEPELVEKLSSMGPDVQNIIGRLTDGGNIDSLGDVEESIKLASVTGGLPAEDARFLSWVQS